MRKKRVISINLTVGKYIDFLDLFIKLAKNHCSSYVCVANVHMCVEAYLRKDFGEVVNGSEITTPDGMPLCIALKLLYGIDQERVAGMDLLPAILKKAEEAKITVFFYGASSDVLAKIKERAKTEFPGLEIAGMLSPPFRPLTPEEERQHAELINSSGSGLVLVALGCPNQELWMARQRGTVNALMIGVGAAFPVYAKVLKRAPVWMQKCSLEWLYRLMQEPRRLFKRYLVTNLLFIVLLLWQFIKKTSQLQNKRAKL